MPKRIFISAGEPSGDLHGGKLIEALKKVAPDCQILAIGGDLMAKAGAELIFHIKDTSFMGFWEVAKHWRTILQTWKKTIQTIHQFQPHCVVTIDYPGFNLRLAKAVAKLNIPVIYYISPQIWAWHQSRIQKIKKYVKEVLCILPFEVEWYCKNGVRAQFVGHPLLDQELSLQPPTDFATIKHPIIGLFPGSRQQEVEKLLPVMVAAVKILKKKVNSLQAIIARAPNISEDLIKKFISGTDIKYVSNLNYHLMKAADALIIASGTATVEATLHQTPYVVVYKVNPLSYLLARTLVKVNSITIANLIAGKRGIVELVQSKASPERIAYEIFRILTDKEYNKTIRNFLHLAASQLGSPGASQRAAQAIMRYINHV